MAFTAKYLSSSRPCLLNTFDFGMLCKNYRDDSGLQTSECDALQAVCGGLRAGKAAGRVADAAAGRAVLSRCIIASLDPNHSEQNCHRLLAVHLLAGMLSQHCNRTVP